ncbi:ABC transporter permease [Anaerosalibacter massiliensis]|uniref:ABC transporter permease n=1 Tax=Anaerosalibacter massiliensis TaxID=1347392 RepID=A0A9X2S885_9FIRM|nr:ABC transporter permease [Anaerosalibacter massiliensis]MCR2045572.1 ABC transporter permease [Anaerosalibacter massiliensis]
MNKFTRVVFKKEIIDTFRDKKTIFSSIIIPIIIFPLIAFVFGIGSSDIEKESKEPVQIAILSEEKNELESFLLNHKDINIVKTEDAEKALDKLDIKVIVKIGENFDEKIQQGEKPRIELIYDDASQKSEIGKSRVEQIISGYTGYIVAKRLENAGVNPQILEPIDIKYSSVSKEGGTGLMIFSMMLPFMLTIWSAVGGIPAATDLGAGEKERQTLEPLLTTKSSRMSILMGKYFAVVVAGVIATIASLIGFLIATKINPDFLGEGTTLSIKAIGIITLVCLEMALAFSSIELAISFYARNFKEAQTYLSPVSIVLMVPAYLTMFVDGRAIPRHYFHIPIINTIGVIKEVIVSVYDMKHILITTGWNLLYIALFLTITVKMFEKETVIFRN